MSQYNQSPDSPETNHSGTATATDVFSPETQTPEDYQSSPDDVVSIEFIPGANDNQETASSAGVTVEERLAADEDLAFAREHFALSAMKAGRRVIRSNDGNEAYEQSKERYLNEMKRVAEAELEVALASAEEVDESMTLQRIASQISIIEARAVTERKHEAFLETRFGKFTKWYGELSKTKKIAYGIGAVGAISTLGSVAGAAGVASGVAVGARLSRNYIGGLRHRTSSSKEVADGAEAALVGAMQREVVVDTPDSLFTLLGRTMDDRIDMDIEQNRKAAKRAGIIGALGIAGGVIMEYIAADDVVEASAQGGEVAEESIPAATQEDTLNPVYEYEEEVGPQDSTTEIAPDVEEAELTEPATPEELPHDETVDIEPDESVADTEVEELVQNPENLIDVEDFNYDVAQGEGFTHVMKGLAETYGIEGLEPKDYYDVYKQFEGDFSALEAEGIAYRMPSGDWGISSPGELQFDQVRVQQYLTALQEHADMKAGLETPSAEYVLEAADTENVIYDADLDDTVADTSSGNNYTIEYGGSELENVEVNADEIDSAEVETETETSIEAEADTENANEAEASSTNAEDTEAATDGEELEEISDYGESRLDDYEKSLNDPNLANPNPITMAQNLWPNDWKVALEQAISNANLGVDFELAPTGTQDFELRVADGSGDVAGPSAYYEVAKAVLALAKR